MKMNIAVCGMRCCKLGRKVTTFLSNLQKPSTWCGRHEVSIVVLLSIHVFWDVILCSCVSIFLVSNECSAS